MNSLRLKSWRNGDTLHRYQKALVLVFGGARRVLSTSVFNGGCKDDLKFVFNHDGNPGTGMACKLEAETYEAHLALIAERLGLDPTFTTGLSTAASMDNVAIVDETFGDLEVTAIVTGGVEVNGGRVGDPAVWYNPKIKNESPNLGTINTFLYIDANLPPGILARALVTATEAKTAALQELMANSNYSSGIATGSGTDGTVVITNRESDLCFENAGKHSKLGELIGKAVLKATKEALAKQSGFTPVSMHNITKRMKRYNVTEEYLWNIFSSLVTDVEKYEFLDRLHRRHSQTEWVVPTLMAIHILDEWQWGLIDEEGVRNGLSTLGLTLTEESLSVENVVYEWCKLLLRDLTEIEI